MPPDEAIRDWYLDDTPTPATPTRAAVTWEHIFTCWKAVEVDFHHYFHADFGDGILHRRTWRWFSIRIAQLLSDNNSQLAAALRELLGPTTGGTPRG